MSKHNEERDNLVDLQMSVTDIMLRKARGEEVEVTAQELNAMTKHLANNKIDVQSLIDIDNEGKEDTGIEIELPDTLKTQFKKLG